MLRYKIEIEMSCPRGNKEENEIDLRVKKDINEFFNCQSTVNKN